jgi:hypothetical protein
MQYSHYDVAYNRNICRECQKYCTKSEMHFKCGRDKLLLHVQICKFLHNAELYQHTFQTLWRTLGFHRAHDTPVVEFIVPEWGDKVDYGIGLSYRPARLYILHRLLAGQYDNPLPELTTSPHIPTVRDYECGLSRCFPDYPLS